MWREMVNLHKNDQMYIKAILLMTMLLVGQSFTMSLPDKIDPEKLYKNNCRLCHGSKGKLGIGGASDLSKSTLNVSDAIAIIKKGKGSMTAFEGILSDKEIKAIAKYIQQLKK